MNDGVLLPPLPAVLGLLAWLALLGLSRLRGVRRRLPCLTIDLAAAGLLGLLCAGFHWRALFTREASVPAGGGDFNSFYFPLARFAADQVQTGRIPLWNPTLFAGAPFAADFQTGLLYPPNLLAFLVARPFEYGALEALAILHFWLASLTAYILWRSLGGSSAAGLVAGITYAYGGFLVAHLGHPPMFAVAAWLPLLLVYLRLALLRTHVRWIGAAALTLAVMILAGHPQVLLISLVVAAAWSATVAWRAQPPVRAAHDPAVGDAPPPASRSLPISSAALWHWLTSAAIGGAVLLLGVALAAPVLLPAIQLSRRSVRAALSYAESTAFSLRPLHLVHLLVPKAFGDSPTSYLDALAFNGEVWTYAGVATLLLAVVALRGRPHWPVILGAALVLLGLLLALGPATPLHGWLYRFVPGFGQARAPGRWSLVYSLGLALAAAGGVDTLLGLLRGHVIAAQPLLRVLVRWLGLAAGAIAAVLLLLTGQLLEPRDPSAPLANFLDGLGWLLVLVLLLLGLIYLLYRGAVPVIIAGAMVVALVVLDLFSAHVAFNPTTADLTAGFRHPEIVAALHTTAEPGASTQAVGAALSIRIDSDTGAPELWQPSAAAVLGLRDISGAYNPLGIADYATFYDVARRDRTAPLYNLLAVTHVIARADTLPRMGAVEPVMTSPSDLVLYERQQSLPRALVVHQARVLGDPAAALAALRDPSFAPASEVLLLTGLALPPAGNTAPPSRPATITRDEPDLVEISASADAPAYLLIADTFYPGWRAEVDGQPAPVERANYTFRAVPLSPGEHTVRLIFDPPLWRIGWLLALPAGLVTLLLLVTPTRVWRRLQHTPALYAPRRHEQTQHH